MTMEIKVLGLAILLAVLILFIVGIINAIIDNPRRMKEEREHGYDSAVADILRRKWYWDREKDSYVNLEVMVIDGKVTPDWENRFQYWFNRGEDCAIDTFVLAGVMSKKTGEKFKRRFHKTLAEKFEKERNGIDG